MSKELTNLEKDLKLVEIVNDKIVVSSLQVAEKFEKEHKNILRLLSSKLSGANKDRLSQHFFKDNYKDKTGKSNSMYFMDRDGFSFLDMGYSYSDVKYILAKKYIS